MNENQKKELEMLVTSFLAKNDLIERDCDVSIAIRMIPRQAVTVELESTPELDKKLCMSLEDFLHAVPLQIRTRNMLLFSSITRLGMLVRTPEPKLLKNRNFGYKGLYELKKELKEHFGLGLGLNHIEAGPEERKILAVTETRMAIPTTKRLIQERYRTLDTLIGESKSALIRMCNQQASYSSQRLDETDEWFYHLGIQGIRLNP